MLTFRKTNMFKTPSEVILLADNRWLSNTNTKFDHWYHLLTPLSANFSTAYWSVIYPKHVNSANTAYLDGHVGDMKNPSALYGNAENDKIYFGAQE